MIVLFNTSSKIRVYLLDQGVTNWEIIKWSKLGDCYWFGQRAKCTCDGKIWKGDSAFLLLFKFSL